MSDFIPNSFQVPNAYIDRFWHLLRPAEKDVLIYLFRRIYGFYGKTCDAVSLSQFCEGIVTKEGKRLDYGTGWGRTSVLRAIEELRRFLLVVLVQEAVKHPPSARRAAVYALQLDPSKVDMAALEARAAATKMTAQERTANARAVCETNRTVRFVSQTDNYQAKAINREVVGADNSVVEAVSTSFDDSFGDDFFGFDAHVFADWSEGNDAGQ